MNETPAPKETIERFGADLARVRAEVGKMIVGQHEILDGVLICLFAGGQVLLEGVPGLGKTMLVRTLADALDLQFSRVQFTPDLMPADILGTTVLTDDGKGGHRLEFRKGPIFANIVLADEVNRATPKTQSALLEVMQEHSVTIGTTTHRLEEPYFVLATQNPLEMEGTYPLPEAQLDRFMFKLEVGFPSRDELHAILDRTTGSEAPSVEPVLDAKRILELRAVAREVPVAHHVKDYAIRILEATHPDRSAAPDMVRRFVRFGSSPRGVQAILLAAKLRALFDGRFSAGVEDVRWAVKPSLRHRIILNFEGEAEGVKSDAILDKVLETVRETPKS
jgi:MoxR-like ATPase